MKIKPVKLKKKPNYPTLEYYINNPEMLSRSIPESWMNNKYVATSLATFILCGNPNTFGKESSETIEIVERIKNYIKDEAISDKEDPVKVAPIFAHGNGSGATGCIVMSPPVFISEDEARKIIFDALKASNISFDTSNCPTLRFKAPPIANSCYNDDPEKEAKADVTIKMDGYNADLNLAIQFVSADDYYKFRSDDGCWSSVQGYNTKQAAELIREELNLQGKTNSVVFYDPITSIDYKKNNNWEKGEKKAKEESEKLILAQVNDFINWLKNEKIIE